MKRLTRRYPKADANASSWGRVPSEDGGCIWRLFRRDKRRVVHGIQLVYSARMCRRAVARDLRAAYRELRDRVDTLDLTLLEAA